MLAGGFATLVARDVPAGSVFGLDCKQYTTGSRFMGVTRIPPGLHIAYFGAGGAAQLQALVLEAAPGDVVVRSWSAAHEDLSADAGMRGEDEARLCAAVRRLELADSLAPFDAAELELARWRNLTTLVSAATLARCGVPHGTKVRPAFSRDEEAELEKELADAARRLGSPAAPVAPPAAGAADEPEPEPEGGAVQARYTDVAGPPPAGLRAAELSKYALDRSARVEELIAGPMGGRWQELVGEMQLAFAFFLLLGASDAFQQWKALVTLLCACEDGMAARPELFATFARALEAQLMHAPPEMLQEDGNFIAASLGSFFELMEPVEGSPPMDAALVAAAARLARFVRERFDIEVAVGAPSGDVEALWSGGAAPAAAAAAAVAVPPPAPESGPLERMSWMLPPGAPGAGD